MPSLYARICAAIIACASSCVLAQSPGTLGSVVVTASRMTQPIADLLADVTVIGGDEILRSGGQSLTEVLQRQPGTEITMNGGPGSTSGAYLRGANSGQTLVLIDGLRVGSASVGATSLEAIPLDQIDRVEILRGPASSLYGADAIGGVIQVFTKRAQGDAWAGSVSGGYGTYDTWSGNATLRGAMGPIQFSITGGGTHSSGFNAIVNSQNFSYNPDRDGYSTQNIGANAILPWAPGQEVVVQYFTNRLNNQFDAGAPYFDDRTTTTLGAWSAQSRNKLDERWSSLLTIGEGSDDSVSTTLFGESPFKTTQRQYVWQNDLTLPLGTLALALERREEHLSTTDEFAVTQRNTNSVTGVYEFAYDAFALQVNLRHDQSNQYGGETTGGIAAGYRFAPGWRLTAGYSTGFRAPSFNDLYFPGFSNPNLAPETARNAEAAIYWSETRGDWRWQASAVGYYNKVGQLIVFECDASFDCAPQNVERARLKGVTLGIGINWKETQVTGSLDLQSPEDAATGNLLPRRARQHGALQVLQQLGPAQAGLEFVASSLRYDDAANTIKMGGYGIVNLTLQWPFARGWSLLLRGNNVFDKNYQLAADYSTGGAQFFAGVQWQP
ncbi:MAG TPA: TonB-dependent receptor [Casimicrobiaceae bacterium]|nr:TonB-dependent receptor [Casimicrobiaceae bacterium]